MSVIKGLMWCLTILFAQLGLLRYVDIRVAAMPRLHDTPQETGADALAADKDSGLDA
ncbi:hypothetical protein [Halomonas sp. A29]|uniref:hypothetical protein n=1 Tax=Halomonas sp. A29 TaxID=3102786 RepID=UPI00398B83DC